MKKQVVLWLVGIIFTLAVLGDSTADAPPIRVGAGMLPSASPQRSTAQQPSPLAAARGATCPLSAAVADSTAPEAYLSISGVPAQPTATATIKKLAGCCRAYWGTAVMVALLSWIGVSVVFCAALFFVAARPLPAFRKVEQVASSALAEEPKRATMRKANPRLALPFQETQARQMAATLPITPHAMRSRSTVPESAPCVGA